MRKNLSLVSWFGGNPKFLICSGVSKTVIASHTVDNNANRQVSGLTFIGDSWQVTNESSGDKTFVHSGAVVLTSWQASISGTLRGITFNGVDLISAASITSALHIHNHSGVSGIIKSSYRVDSVDLYNFQKPEFDGLNLWFYENVEDIIFQQSGVTEDLILTSFASENTDGDSLAFNGKNLHSIGNVFPNPNFIYTHSGLTGTIINSFTHYVTNIVDTAFETTISSSDCIELNNGNLLSVYNSDQGGSTYNVKSKVFTVSTQTWESEVAVDSNNTGYTHPAVVQLASDASIPNRILLVFRDKAANTINIFKSDDTGASYSSLSTIGIVLEENDRIGLARSGNNILITYHRGRVSYSRKSTDNGLTWGSEVIIATDALYPDISVLDTGSFIAVIETFNLANNIHGLVYTYSSADGSSWAQTSANVMAEAANRYTRPTIVVDDTGLINVIAQNKVTKDLAITRTSGVITTSWGAIHNINPLPDQGNTITGPYNMGLFAPSACIHEGRIFVQAEAWDGTDGHMIAFKTQSWRTVNEITGFSYYYYPIMGLPDVIGGWSGTNIQGTGSVESGGILNLVVTSAVNDLVTIGDGNNKIYIHSGISKTIKDSFASPSTLPIAVCFDNSNNLITTDGDIVKILFHNGVTSTITNSFDSQGTYPSGIAVDRLGNLIEVGIAEEIIYVHSGLTSIITDSFSSPNLFTGGITFDNFNNLISSGFINGIIYVHSGITKIITRSFAYENTSIIGLGIGNSNRMFSTGNDSNRAIYIHSGITATILSSFTSPDTLVQDVAFPAQKRSYTKSDIGGTRTSTGMKLRFKVKVNSGSSVTADDAVIRIILSDGTNDAKVKIRLTTTGFRFIDENDSDATIADVSHALTEHHEFLIAIKNNDLSAWYRKTHDNEIKWTNIVDNYQVDVTGTETNSSIEFGILTAIANIDIYEIGYEMNDDGLSDGFTTPDDLVSRFTATGSKAQHLLEGVSITWDGSSGVINDLWTIKSAFTFPKEDLVTDSPSDFVRTENDNTQHVYIFDAGENKVFNVDQMNLIGSNFRTGSIQMNATDSWGSPTLDQSFTVASEISGSVTSVTENTLTDSSLSLRLNQLARSNKLMYLRMTSGTANGLTYAIESNTGTLIKTITATLVADGVSISDTYVVFIDRITQQVTSTSLRYMRLVIDAQHTADDYYKIGKFIAGIRLDMSKNFNSKYKFKITPNININKSSRAGQKFTVKRGESRRVWDVTFKHITSAVTKEFEEFFEAIDWANNPFIFINDSANLQDFILGRIANNYLKDHIITDIYNINKFSIEEEL